VSSRVRPDVVVFDVVETLASLDEVAALLAEYGLGRSMLTGWFTRLPRDGMALTIAGGFAGSRRLLRQHCSRKLATR